VYGMQTNEKTKKFIDMYISCDVSLHYQTHYKMHNNIITHIHIKKNHVVCRFHYLLPPMCEIKILKPLQINGIIHFHNNTSKHKQTKYFNL
jgi:hypothetical protein